MNIELNQGAKWRMDEHTRSTFKAMVKRVDAGGEAKTVGAGLSEDLENLIQGCTMTGEAHDQLHVFLMSYMPAVREVERTGSEEALAKVKGLLDQYPEFFE